MTDREEKVAENPQTLQADAATVAHAPQAAEPVKAAPKPHPVASKGEKLYEKVVYTGINYFLNLGISLVITDFCLHGKGRGFYDSTNNLVNRVLKAAQVENVIGKKAMERATNVAVSAVTLNSGGNLLLIPMKVMEDNKRPLVHWINKNIYKDPQLAPDGHEETSQEIYIEKEQPPQSLGNVFIRRLKAMGATIVTGLAIDNLGRKKFDTPQVIDGKTVTQIEGQDRFTGKVVDITRSALPANAMPKGGAVERYISYAALDTIYTWITSTVMHMTNGAKAKVHVPPEIGNENDPEAVVGLNEVIVLPKGEKIVQTQPAAEDKNAKYKKKAAAPVQKHTDHIKPDDGVHSVAP